MLHGDIFVLEHWCGCPYLHLLHSLHMQQIYPTNRIVPRTEHKEPSESPLCYSFTTCYFPQNTGCINLFVQTPYGRLHEAGCGQPCIKLVVGTSLTKSSLENEKEKRSTTFDNKNVDSNSRQYFKIFKLPETTGKVASFRRNAFHKILK